MSATNLEMMNSVRNEIFWDVSFWLISVLRTVLCRWRESLKSKLSPYQKYLEIFYHSDTLNMISEFSFLIPMINYGNKAVGDLITIFSTLLDYDWRQTIPGMCLFMEFNSFSLIPRWPSEISSSYLLALTSLPENVNFIDFQPPSGVVCSQRFHQEKLYVRIMQDES